MRRNFTVDDLLTIKASSAVAADAAAQVAGVDHIEDIGAGFVQGNLVLDVTAIDIASVAAQGTLTLAVNPTDNDTMVIGAVTYRFKSTLAQANDIKIGTDAAATQVSIVKTLNGTGVAGTDYYTGTVSPAVAVSASDFAENVCTLTARTAGAAGNSIATTENFTSGSNVFDAVTLGTARTGITANERYDILLQGSNSATFASGVVVLARVAVGIAALVNASANTGIGRIVVPFTNEFMETVYQYVRIYTDVSGSAITTGITYSARIAK